MKSTLTLAIFLYTHIDHFRRQLHWNYRCGVRSDLFSETNVPRSLSFRI